MSKPQLEAVARLFSVLSEPSRLSILQALMQTEMSVTALVEQLDLRQANVSKQLAILHEAKLVGRRRDGNSVYYSIADPVVFELCGIVCGKIQNDAKQMAAAVA